MIINHTIHGKILQTCTQYQFYDMGETIAEVVEFWAKRYKEVEGCIKSRVMDATDTGDEWGQFEIPSIRPRL